MSQDIADVLERAAARCERGWTRRVLARSADGQELESVDPAFLDAACFCASGAIIAEAGSDCDLLFDAWAALERVLDGPMIVTWNDAPGRTQAEVVAKLREAAAKAREQSV